MQRLLLFGLILTFPLFTACEDDADPGLTLVMQASLDQSQIPNDWRHALVAPVFKSGKNDKAKAENIDVSASPLSLVKSWNTSSIAASFPILIAPMF